MARTKFGDHKESQYKPKPELGVMQHSQHSIVWLLACLISTKQQHMFNYILFSLILVSTASACSKHTPGSQTDTTAVDTIDSGRLNVRMMTYNVHHCAPYVPGEENQHDIGCVAAVITAAGTDMVLLQELDRKRVG